jgi:Tfp pilus assembly protein PilO
MVAGVGGMYEYLAPNLKTSRGDLVAAQAKLEGLNTDIKVLTNAQALLQASLDTMQKDRGVDFSRIPYIYPKTEDIPGLYLQLEGVMRIAQAEGVALPSYQVSAPVLDSTENSVHIPVTVSGTGSYDDLKNFITKLEQNLRPLSIESLNLSQTLDKDKGTPTGEFTLNLAGIIRAQSLSPAYTGTPAS